MTGRPIPRRGASLAERSAASGIGGAVTSEETSTEQARHCWVDGPEPWPGRWPGLLIAWRRPHQGLWEGRVVFVIGSGDQAQVVERWLDGGRLTPADAIPAEAAARVRAAGRTPSTG